MSSEINELAEKRIREIRKARKNEYARHLALASAAGFLVGLAEPIELDGVQKFVVDTEVMNDLRAALVHV